MTSLHTAPRGPVGHAPSPLVWAWTANLLTPVMIALTMLPHLSLAGASPEGGVLGGAALAVMALAIPTCGVVMAVRASREGLRSSRAAVVIAVLLLVASVVLLPLTAVTVEGAVIGTALCAVGLLVGLRRRPA
jgi:hypothetical protein